MDALNCTKLQTAERRSVCRRRILRLDPARDPSEQEAFAVELAIERLAVADGRTPFQGPVCAAERHLAIALDEINARQQP